MFGEVFDLSDLFTSTLPPNKMQAVLDFPFQDAARSFASEGTPASWEPSSGTTTGIPTPTPTSTSCRPSSVTTTWAGSASS